MTVAEDGAERRPQAMRRRSRRLDPKEAYPAIRTLRAL